MPIFVMTEIAGREHSQTVDLRQRYRGLTKFSRSAVRQAETLDAVDK
jgi:hypothetical protein